jgi:hypothetical protein
LLNAPRGGVGIRGGGADVNGEYISTGWRGRERDGLDELEELEEGRVSWDDDDGEL